MNYCGLNKCDFANGDGLRVTLFVSGCTLHCKGCFNKEAWDFNYGKGFTVATLFELFMALGKPYIKGLTILGGDPLEEQNIGVVTFICETVKTYYPDKDIWLYTGRKWDEFKDTDLINYVDVVKVGAFIESKKVYGEYFGSSNQKIIRINKKDK